MGVQAWMRAFSGPHLIVFLPQAYFWTKVRQGNSRAAKRFIWVTQRWVKSMGWITSLAVLIISGSIIHFYRNDNVRRLLLSPRVSAHTSECEQDCEWLDGPGGPWLEAVGWIMWPWEVATWFMFYWSESDAIKYAKYIAALDATPVQDSTNSF